MQEIGGNPPTIMYQFISIQTKENLRQHNSTMYTLGKVHEDSV